MAGRNGAETAFWRGRGCAKCFDLGYRGRSGIYELLPMSDLV